MKRNLVQDNKALKSLKAENLQLKNAIKRKAVELNKKDRELEIDTALERVRVIALGMKAPADMLDVCKTISLQLQSLGVKEIRNVQTAIFNVKKGAYMNYEYYAKHKKTFITETLYTNHKIARTFASRMMKGKGQTHYTYIKGQKVRDWLNYQKGTNVFIDKYLEKATSLNYYWHSLGPVALGISTYAPLSKEDLVLFRRFLNVFELAYTRYMDIEQAIMQAREAQIEAALERIRARALAMHRSEELLEVAKVLREQLDKLGQPELETSAIHFYEQDPAHIVSWRAFRISSSKKDSITYSRMDIPKNSCAFVQEMENGYRNKEKNYTLELKGKVQQDWYKVLFKLAPEIGPAMRKSGNLKAPRHYHFSKFKGGALLMVSAVEPSAQSIDLQQRAAGVFNLAFRRFEDLQKAEAQAREATIEVALERVRYRAMAMQSSNDVGEATSTMFEELDKLGIETYRCGIALIKGEELEVWSFGNTGNGRTVKGVGRVAINLHPLWRLFKESVNRKEVFLHYYLAGQEKEDYARILTTADKYSLKGSQLNFPDLHFQCYTFEEGGLFAFSLHPHSESDKGVMKRFTNVFSLTFRRYLDLKQAEAQAKESQIEAALERVRSRTMGMQKSEELKEVIQLVYEQLLQLNIHIGHTGFVIDYKAREDYDIWVADPIGVVPSRVIIPYFDSVYYNRFNEAKEKGEDFFATLLDFEEKNNFYQKLFEYIPELTEEAKNFYFNCPGLAASTVLLEDIGLYIENFDGIPYSEEENGILMRFGKVFQQTYTRFLDLKNAEAQAREAKIEAALEKIRGRTMAMQHSSELGDAANLLFRQLKELGIDTWTCGYNIWQEDKKAVTAWLSHGNMQPSFNYPLTENPTLKHFYEAALRGESLFVEEVSGETLAQLYRDLASYHELQPAQGVTREPGFTPPALQVNHAAYFSYGYLLIVTYKPYPEAHDIFKRFAAVFDQTYTRFLDLQKAEAQAREAQIQLALERVRARTMAMQNSEELAQTAAILFQQIKELGIDPIQITIGMVYEEEGMIDFQVTGTDHNGAKIDRLFQAGLDEPTLINKLFIAWKNKERSVVIGLEGKELQGWIKYRNAISGISSAMEQIEIRRYICASNFSKGLLSLSSTEEPSAETIDIMERFAAVFDQTYTRFLDLKKAEAQAREARIETALEKIRSRTMAMQRSEELSETVTVLFDQLRELGEQPERAFIGIVNEPDWVIEVWATQHGGQMLKMSIKATIDEPYVMNRMYKAWKEQKRSLIIDLKEHELEGYYQFLVKVGAPVSREIFGDRRFENIAFFSKGMLGIITPEEQTAAAIQLYERFASVFDLTYTRFLDLKNAEAQAREARIEASLERVRGKAMAMHSSKDLSETVNVFFGELKALGITPIRCGVGAVDEKERTSTISATTAQQQGESYEVIGRLKLEGHPVLDNIFQHWRSQEEYFPVLRGKEITSYYKVMKPQVSLPDYPEEATQYGCYFYFKEGLVFAWSEKEFTDEELKIFRRFTTVISLTYRRYIELQKSEANAREAVKQASLDRVRAEIASMRTIDDLERITPLIWKELTILGVPFIRCGVFIMDNEQSLMHTFLSTPDGKAIAAFHLPYDTPGNVSQILHNWQQKKIYTDHWDETTFVEWTQILVQRGAVTAKNDYLASFPKGGFCLHFVPFLQGMLYVGNGAALSKSDIRLLQSVADAFSTAYARYEDFNKLELAKQQVEKTLTDLKQAQQQLVQSEKMASLGELTAGIAHEIQNPLNFVNNFSEVSSELLEEMKDELEKGNAEEAKAIADDVKQNLEKISHHGKRADAIVKGMLQHSRSSSGQKEPTDINALCDEYLRLSYHGLRAKDKTFNANFKTEFDNDLGKVNIIPQDVGRVILNLINNAFYAVADKRKQALPGYEPIVTVSTKKKNGNVEISVADNGMGIPPKVLDKIFQPFFTTKPTGQGTGLGLSLSYDIITKGHGGEIKVETKEGEGTSFIIVLPG